jgi:putative ABC transport system permease protein
VWDSYGPEYPFAYEFLDQHFERRHRTKEIGVRKVLGASGLSILVILAREMGRLFAVGVIVSVPVGVWGADQWLAGFPYRIEVGLPSVAGAVAAVLFTATLAMSQQMVRASQLHPVDALRSD